MSKLKKVIQFVESLYLQKNPVIDWNNWVFNGHNRVVASWVEDIAQHYSFNTEAVLAAAYLHDLAYAWTSKNDPHLEEKSEIKAKEILQQAGYSSEETSVIVENIIHGHGMHDGEIPSLIEARVLATADAMAHFSTDFYLVMCWNHYLFEGKDLSDYKEWVLQKIERDLNNKIFFDEYKIKALPYYEATKRIFSL